MIDANEVLRALSQFGVVQWARISVGIDPVDGVIRPPFLIWRYQNPEPNLSTQLHTALATFESDEEWEFDASQRNWTLIPARVALVLSTDSAHFSGRAAFRACEQDFCAQATDSLVRLLEHFRGLPSAS